MRTPNHNSKPDGNIKFREKNLGDTWKYLPRVKA